MEVKYINELNLSDMIKDLAALLGKENPLIENLKKSVRHHQKQQDRAN